MYPHLITLGGRPVSTYSVLVVTGLLAGIFVAGRLARRDGLDEHRIFMAAWLSIFAGFVGARLLFVFTQLPYFLEHPLAIVRFWEGWAFLGGPIAGFIAVLWYAQSYHLPIWKTLDALTAGLALGLMFGRFGCLMGGCCFGRPTGCAFGVRLYGDNLPPPLRGVPLHPTQLYEAVGLLLLFCGLLWVYRHRAFDGQVFLLFFIAYSILRGVIEFFRGDASRGYVLENVLSTSQFVSILIVIPAAAVYAARQRTALRAERNSVSSVTDGTGPERRSAAAS